MFAAQDAGDVAALPLAFAGLGRDAVMVELLGDLVVAATGLAPALHVADDLLFGGVVEQLAGRGKSVAIRLGADEALLIEAAVKGVLTRLQSPNP